MAGREGGVSVGLGKGGEVRTAGFRRIRRLCAAGGYVELS